MRSPITDLIEQAGYAGSDPIVVGVRRGDAPPTYATRGPMTAGTVVYTASLSKLITAACAALLVRRGRLDTESRLARWLPELPAWSADVRVRHLIHHTGGLPDVEEFEAGRDRTTAGVLDVLRRHDRLSAEPGTAFRYSNAGYVCLAVVVERTAGRPLPDFAREHVFAPLGMAATYYWSGPESHPRLATPLAPSAPRPLSLGDGGRAGRCTGTVAGGPGWALSWSACPSGGPAW